MSVLHPPNSLGDLNVRSRGDGIGVVFFLDYDLGCIDLDQRTLQTLDNPFGPRLLPMS